jgi:hypothetical protein
MALNFGILQPVNIGGQIIAGEQETQRNQLAQQQLAAGQQQMKTSQLQQQHTEMQMEQAMRERDALAKMQKAFIANGKSGDLNANFTEMMNSGIPHFVDIGVKGLQTLQNQKNFESLLKGPSALTGMPSVAPPSGTLGSGTFDPNAPTSTPVTSRNAMAPAPLPPVNAMAAGPDLADMRRKIDAAYALGTPQALAYAKEKSDELRELSKPQVTPAGSSVYVQGQGFVGTAPEKANKTEMQRNYEFAQSQGFKGSLFDYERQLKEATRPPAQPAPLQPPVAVVDPITNKQVFVSREEALSKRMTPATAMEGLAPKEIQTREAKFPAATSAIKTFETSADRLAADLEKLAKHPGLSGISGLIYGRTPAVTKEARAAQALYDSIVARGGFQELQNMRSSSPTGGALGNVSNQEGQYLRDAFAPINRTQDTADLSRSLTEAANATKASKQRLREAYDMTYDYKNQGGAATPAASSGGKVVDFGSLK